MHPYEAMFRNASAPERFGGFKLVTVEAVNGKLTPEAVKGAVHGVGVPHHSQVRAVSLSQSSELGTVYTPQEVTALCQTAHALDLYVHMDGARLANAAASLGVPLRAFTSDAGVDVVSFGGTKNGLMLGEAVVFLKEGLDATTPWVRKQAMQLASKMRFVAAQFEAVLEDDLWLKLAGHANGMATRLWQGVRDVPGVDVSRPVDANAVFARLPRTWLPALQAQFAFYVWDQATTEVRWMCSHDTTAEDVDALVAAVKAQRV